jgi:hypothetical protein
MATTEAPVFAPPWADRYADCLTVISLSEQLLARPRPLQAWQQERLRLAGMRAKLWLQALEQEPHEL